jgi:hypothetical protein
VIVAATVAFPGACGIDEDLAHWYVLLRNQTNWRDHLRFPLWIRLWGFDEFHRLLLYRYWDVGEHSYWALGRNNIINRRAEV